MPKINRLPKSIYELIAAGEVVERPASVVKELVENSIDAGAKDITVEIQNGGIKYIRITDNGCGISREDVPLAFTSHATSKISREEDLFSIGTLGFRGEALASISAVSHTEMLTRTNDSNIGTRMTVSGGEFSKCEDAGCPAGTTIIIRDLFYNTPARMKFLKTDRSEGMAVAGIVDKIALSHPEISFRFIKDGKQLLCTSGNGELYSAIYSVFGKEFAETLIPASYDINGITVRGYISKPFNSRGSNSMQTFFVNDRFIKSRTACAALNEAYKNSVMVGRYPACVLFITTPPQAVDVNVHPAKTEVRFSNEKAIFDVIYYAAKNALNGDDSRPQASFKRNELLEPAKSEPVQERLIIDETSPVASSSDIGYNSFAEKHRNAYIPNKPQQIFYDSGKTNYNKSNDDDTIDLSVRTVVPTQSVTPPISENKTEISEEFGVKIVDDNEKAVNIRYIGEAFKTYIFAEFDGKLIIIDKHAAHERMLFNKLKKENGKNGSQMLLSPISVTLSKEEYAAILENIGTVRESGFEIDDFGEGTVIVRACPLNLEKENIVSLITEIAGYLLKNQRDILPEKLDWIYHSIACRAAIKAGNNNSDYELMRFVKKLLTDKDVRYCPHGRPVIVEMTKYELDKQFGRIQ